MAMIGRVMLFEMSSPATTTSSRAMAPKAITCQQILGRLADERQLRQRDPQHAQRLSPMPGDEGRQHLGVSDARNRRRYGWHPRSVPGAMARSIMSSGRLSAAGSSGSREVASSRPSNWS